MMAAHALGFTVMAQKHRLRLVSGEGSGQAKEMLSIVSLHLRGVGGGMGWGRASLEWKPMKVEVPLHPNI